MEQQQGYTLMEMKNPVQRAALELVILAMQTQVRSSLVSEQEEELEKTDRKVGSTRHILKEKEVELKALESKLRRQDRINREQSEELEGHQRKIRKTQRDLKEHEIGHSFECVQVERIRVADVAPRERDSPEAQSRDRCASRRAKVSATGIAESRRRRLGSV